MKGSVLLFLLSMLLFVASSAVITQLTPKNYYQKLQEAPFTLVYFYSSSCKFCKEFTPIYEKMLKNKQLQQLEVAFTKIDGSMFQDFATELEVYSYPSVLFYRKGVDLALHFRKDRKEKEIVEFVLQNIKASDMPHLQPSLLNLTAAERKEAKAALFYGQRNSSEFWAWDVIARRDGYIAWGFVESAQTKLLMGDKQITDFSNLTAIQAQFDATFARLHQISEQSWLKMMEKRKFSIVYFNKYGNKKTVKLLQQIAVEMPDVHFLEINGEHEEYKAALRAIGVHDQENIVSVDKVYDALYIAPTPYNESGLKEFISKAQRHNLTLYRKTEKSEKPNKLTRDNYQAKMGTAQDVLLFLYDKTEPISKQLMKLFQYLLAKLSANKNLLLLRCDVGMNEVEQKLGFVIKPTPKLVFFRNRMKDYPIHFSAKTISVESVIEFIMENTTFDFEDEWAEL